MRPELELVAQWLQRATIDMRSALADIDATPPITEDACFHCQQVIEKCLKAFLVFSGIEFEHTHVLERLIQQCAAVDLAFDSLHDTADRLTTYAVRFRYPYLGPPPTIERTRQNLDIAKQVWNFVTSRLPSEVVPRT